MEAQARVAAHLSLSVALNAWHDEVTVVERAVTRTDHGRVTYAAVPHNPGGTRMLPPDAVPGGPRVATVRLDTLWTAYKAQHPDHPITLMKIDVEGAADEVLRSGPELMRGPDRPHHLVVELWSFNLGLLAELYDWGYTCSQIKAGVTWWEELWSDTLDAVGLRPLEVAGPWRDRDTALRWFEQWKAEMERVKGRWFTDLWCRRST